MSQHYHIEQEVEKALPVLQKGGTILYPTDTIWGIGCDATQEDAVKKIYRIKQRQDSKSLITLVDSIDMLRDYLTLLPPGTEALMAQAKRPLTIIYPDAKGLAPNVISPDGSAAIRVVRHPFCQALVRALGKPLVSTSANLSGQPSPMSYGEIHPAILVGVDYVINLPSGLEDTKPSTIIKIDALGQQTLIRP